VVGGTGMGVESKSLRLMKYPDIAVRYCVCDLITIASL
jgi:hypothetical protein